jgi:4'-phosphopantetheinyl transferase
MSEPVQIWQIPLEVSEDTLQHYVGCLSGDERSRADRFRFPHDRRKFIVARGTLRHLLARQLDSSPQAIEFCYGEYGKPLVEGLPPAKTAQSSPGHCDFNFNISHSGEIALCALGHHRRVGVDIEKLKPIQRLESMMERCLVQKEQAEVLASVNPLQAFLERWTCKEAYLKAIGMGLIQSMQTVEVEVAPPKLVCVPTDCKGGWQLHPIEVPDEYVSALVIEGEAQVTVNHWQHERERET